MVDIWSVATHVPSEAVVAGRVDYSKLEELWGTDYLDKLIRLVAIDVLKENAGVMNENALFNEVSTLLEGAAHSFPPPREAGTSHVGYVVQRMGSEGKTIKTPKAWGLTSDGRMCPCEIYINLPDDIRGPGGCDYSLAMLPDKDDTVCYRPATFTRGWIPTSTPYPRILKLKNCIETGRTPEGKVMMECEEEK